VTTVGAWRSLPGDWTAGRTWIGAHGKPTSDVGGNLLRQLELSKTPWVQVLRTNRTDLDPLYFAIYGDAIYHHGAGFRAGELSPAHRESAPKPLRGSPIPPLRVARRLANGLRWRLWESSVRRRHVRQSKLVYEKIRRGDREWLSELLGS
jgi:hypothetical protein